jgi:D-3-phosphoglycerate dehydrogenase
MIRYLIDFDSTLVAAETLDVLAGIALAGAPDREARTRAVAAVTDRAMAGEVSFAAALRERIDLLDARREHLPALIERLEGALTPSARRNRAFLSRPEVFVVSGGFEEVIGPLLEPLGVTSDRIRANRLLFDHRGRLSGVDPASPLAHDGGKIVAARAIGGALVMVGDGWTDLEVWRAGAAVRFYAYTEVVARPTVVAAADRVAASLEDLLRQEGAVA